MKETQVCSNKGSRPFPRRDNNDKAKYIEDIKNLLLQNHCANFNQTWHKASMDGGNSTLNKKGPFNFQKGDNAFSILIKALWYNHKHFSGERFGPWALVSLKKISFRFVKLSNSILYIL